MMKKTGLFGFLLLTMLLLFAVSVSAASGGVRVYETYATDTAVVQTTEGYSVTVTVGEDALKHAIIAACYDSGRMICSTVYKNVTNTELVWSVPYTFDTVRVFVLDNLDNAAPLYALEVPDAPCAGNEDIFAHTYDDDIDICMYCGQKLQYTEGLEFELINGGTEYAVATNYFFPAEDIVIPRTYNEKPVTEIADFALAYSDMKRVMIRNNIRSLGYSAFQNCPNLSEVILPESVTGMGYNPFSDNPSLVSITVHPENPVYYSEGNCIIETETKELVVGCKNSVIPEDVTSIGFWAFDGCTSLKRIFIPKNVTYISSYAFSGCTGVETFEVDENNPVYHSAGNCLIGTASKALQLGFKTSVIPDDGSVTRISNFGDCTGMKTLAIPESITYISSSAFDNYADLESITVDENNPYYRSSGNCLIETSTGTLILGCNSSVIPDDGSISIIGRYAFEKCDKLTSIQLPDSVTTIDYSAFSDCFGLTEIILPSRVTTIGAWAFSSCRNLQKVTIPASVTVIGDYAFGWCRNLTTIIYEGSETQWEQIGKAGKWDYSSDNYTLTFAVSASEGLAFTSNGDGTCSVSGIGSCTDTEIIIPKKSPDGDKVTAIGDSAFANLTALTKIDIPNSITVIGDSAFASCTALSEVYIPVGITEIGNKAFSGCTSLTVITFDGTSSQWDVIVKGNGWNTDTGDYIVNYYFSKGLAYTSNNDGTCSVSGIGACTDTEIVIPPVSPAGDVVTSIGTHAFSHTRIKGITIPYTVTNIAYEAFLSCSDLTSLVVEKDNPNYYSEGNCIIETATKTLVVGCMRSVIPNSVESIHSHAFYGCDGLTDIYIPENVAFIDSNVFIGCTALQNIEVDVNNSRYHSDGNCLIETMQKAIVLGCKNSMIPDDGSVTRINAFAFNGCNGLKTLTIPDAVTDISKHAFSNCYGLETITVGDNNPNYSDAGNCLIDKTTGTLMLGCNSSSIPDDGSIKIINSGAFQNCESLTGITIPDGVTEIGNFAFSGCVGLTSINIPNSVIIISEATIHRCEKLTDIHYNGTMEQWNIITKAPNWDWDTPTYTVHCTDGDIQKAQ